MGASPKAPSLPSTSHGLQPPFAANATAGIVRRAASTRRARQHQVSFFSLPSIPRGRQSGSSRVVADQVLFLLPLGARNFAKPPSRRPNCTSPSFPLLPEPDPLVLHFWSTAPLSASRSFSHAPAASARSTSTTFDALPFPSAAIPLRHPSSNSSYSSRIIFNHSATRGGRRMNLKSRTTTRPSRQPWARWGLVEERQGSRNCSNTVRFGSTRV